jgi:amidase
VADFGVPVALGTQTGGAILRPASFCGIVGFKPSFGTISRTGLKLAAESLDTIGMLARTVDDIELLFNVFTGAPANTPAAEAEAPRIGLCRTHVWERAEPDTVAAVENAASMFRSAGATIAEVDLPEEFAGLTDARAVINDVERARAMAFEWHHHRKLISAELTATVQRGLETSHETYVEALRLCERLRGRLGEVFGDCDVLLVPCVNGVAPEGLDSTGDPEFQGIWTALHVPTISLPTHQNDAGLPVGVQLVGRSYDDRQLLEIARWVMARAGV